MPKRVVKAWPVEDSCPVCGRRLHIIKDEFNYKEAICDIMKGHCGWWGWWIRGQHRE